MTDRLKKIFSAKEQKTKLITYFVGCHPTYAVSLAAIKSAIDNGASIIELGYPTSEASAEGPIIKAAHDRCLKNGVNLKEVIKLAAEIRNYNNEVGIILMGYMANLYLYPIEKFTKDAAKAGVDGVLVVDAPHELKEENILRAELEKNKLGLIKLISPTTTTERLEMITKLAKGFIYCVNVKGITGVKKAEKDEVTAMINKIKKFSNLPVCSGFGIKTPEDAKIIAGSGCEGIVIGSTLVEEIETNLEDKKLPQIIGNKIKSFVNILN